MLLAGIAPFVSLAQECPPEWVEYTYGGYIYDIESDYNSQNLGQTQFTNKLLNAARANFAKQIEVSVKDNATLKKIAVNGRTTITYSSVSDFSTDVDIRLLETKVKYDPSTKRGFAIACIEKAAAQRYYKNEMNVFFNKISNSLTVAQNYVATGFKYKAKAELESVLSEFKTADEYFFWLAIFDLPQAELDPLIARRYAMEQSVKQSLADLQHSTSICIVCSANIFGTPDKSLLNSLKGELSKKGCHFTDDPAQADWRIHISVTARKYSEVQVGSQTQYVAYADADVSVDKAVTSQRICEERLSVKGVHPFNYTEAARAAFKNLNGQLAPMIIKTIEQ